MSKCRHFFHFNYRTRWIKSRHSEIGAGRAEHKLYLISTKWWRFRQTLIDCAATGMKKSLKSRRCHLNDRLWVMTTGRVGYAQFRQTTKRIQMWFLFIYLFIIFFFHFRRGTVDFNWFDSSRTLVARLVFFFSTTTLARDGLDGSNNAPDELWCVFTDNNNFTSDHNTRAVVTVLKHSDFGHCRGLLRDSQKVCWI